tara:strand:+ start:3183 stop:3509 length:327 start_codon:yes stop_codon:yes gene_type:complete
MDKVTDELSKKELYQIAKEVKAEYVSKATKEMLVSSINEKIDIINAKDASLQENPLGSNGSEECDSDVGQEDVRVVEETLPPVDKFTEAMDKHLEHHRGFHPITGEQV